MAAPALQAATASRAFDDAHPLPALPRRLPPETALGIDADAGANRLQLEIVAGRRCSLRYAGRICWLDATPGWRHLATLTARPGIDVPALQLERDNPPPTRPNERRPLHDARLRACDVVNQDISAALAALEPVHPEAAAHLRAHVRVDVLCRYDPAT